jgi:hypothetical protein
MRVIAALLVALLFQSGSFAAELTVVGAWTLNRGLTTMPDRDERQPPEGRGGGQRRGGRGGIGGVGGRGGGFGGPGGFGGGAPSEADTHRMEAVRARLSEIPDRLIITKTPTSVTIVDGFGRTATLKIDGKKQPRLTGEGEFSSKTHFDGVKLIVEDDFDGPKVTTTYEPILDGGEINRLVVTITVDNMPGAARARLEGRGRPGGDRQARPEVRRIYDADAK